MELQELWDRRSRESTRSRDDRAVPRGMVQDELSESGAVRRVRSLLLLVVVDFSIYLTRLPHLAGQYISTSDWYIRGFVLVGRVSCQHAPEREQGVYHRNLAGSGSGEKRI